MSERVMEGTWNGGGGALSSSSGGPGEVWPYGNGMVPPPSSSDGHLNIFGNSMLLPASTPQFRHRFPQTHFPPHPPPGHTPGPHARGGGGHHHGPLNLLSIPSQHSMVGESADPSSLRVPGPHSPPCQEPHSQPLDLNGHHHHALDDSEEGSEDDDDDDDGSDEEMDDQDFVHPHEQQQQVSMSHPSLSVNEDSLPSCQHSQQQGIINGDSLQANLIAGMEDSCHQKSNLLTSGLSHIHHPHEEEIPAMSHGHPLNSNPISAIPMITGNSLLLSDGPEDEFSENAAAPTLHETDSMDGDAVSGHSVHGKMYVEGRVVFHLKQWTDSGFGNFNSCREQDQQKSQLHRCAVCRLKSPNGQDSLYSNQEKETHRHPVKGVLFTFEDCIIVELYPEQLPGISCSSHSHPLDPKQNVMEPGKAVHPMPIASYINPAVEAHNGQLESIVVSTISLDKSTTIEQGPEDETQGQSWWDEFDSQRAEAEEDSSPDPSADIHQSSCIMNLKLEAQSLQHPYQPQHPEVQEKPMTHDPDSNNGMNEYHFKWKCDRCAIGFLSSDQFESHRCLSTLNVPEPEPIDPLEPDFTENEVTPTENSLILIERSEVDETVEMVDSVNEETRADVKLTQKALVGTEERRSVELKTVAKYPCPVCKKTFKLKKLLKQHLEGQHESGNPFKCGQCKTQYADEKRLKRHSCTLSVQTLKRHQSRNEAQVEGSINLGTEEYDEDDATLNERDESDNIQLNSESGPEIQVHTDESNEATNSSSIKRRPKRVEEAEDKVRKKKLKGVKGKVEDEGRSRQSLTDVPQYQKNQKAEEGVEFDDEDYDYETQTRFLSTTPKEAKNQPEFRSKKGFKCNICGKCFTVERRLLNHKASHRADRSSQCEKCGKKFARKDKLMRHMYVHNEEKMFVCEICEKRFSRRDKLTDHLKSHGTDEIHNCPMCQKQFLRPDILKQHIKLHRMGNKHQCPECLRFVTGKDRLAKHMARHEEAKALGQTLLCPLCTKYFIQRQSLKAHIKKFHPDALIQLESDNGKFDGSPDSPASSDSSSEDSARDPDRPEISSKGSRANVTTVCLLLEDVMGPSKPSSNKPKPFSCPDCTQTFVRKHALRKHVQLKHTLSSEVLRDNVRTLKDIKVTLNDKKEKAPPEVDDDVDEAKDDEEAYGIIGNGKSEESNPSSLSSLSTSSSPPIQLMSSILQQPDHLVQLTHPHVSLGGLALSTVSTSSSITGDLDPSAQSHLTILHSGGSLHQLHPQQAHISAYSHHLALASMSNMVSVREVNAPSSISSSHASSIQQSLQPGPECPPHPSDQPHPQQLGSGLSGAGLGLSMSHHHNIGMGPSSSYVLNYPPSYHYQ